MFFGENVDFWLCLPIEIGCAYVVRTYPRTQSLLSIDPVGVATAVQLVGGTYRRGGYRGAVGRGYVQGGGGYRDAVGRGMKGRGEYSLPLASIIFVKTYI